MKATIRVASALIASSVLVSQADEVAVFGGTYSSWPSYWTSLGLDDSDDGISTAALEIRGNATYPATSYAQDQNYIYFRLQLEAATFNTTTVNGSYLVYVDRVGSGYEDGRADFAFAWDASNESNETSRAKHGLEMMEYASGTGTWGNLRMNDVDGFNNSKGIEDFNGNGRTGDGYLRVLRQQTGVSGVNANSYLEFAVSWNYLQNSSTTGLGRSQNWKIAFGNIAADNDHGSINQNGDVAGNLTYESLLTSGWSASISTVPEIPTSSWAMLCFAVVVAAGRRLNMRGGRSRQSKQG